MQKYAPTAQGEALAKQTGLDDLAARLYKDDDQEYPPVLNRLTEDTFSLNGDIEDIEIQIGDIRSELNSHDEIHMFDRAMSINTDTHSWRHFGDLDEDALFPIRSITPFVPATSDDRLILSGAVGLSLGDFGHDYPLLARTRYQEYGFQSFNEACAFVGAYVTRQIINFDSRRKTEEPSFIYTEDGIQHRIQVSGSIHGDFRIAETTVLQSDIISPIQTMTEFSPMQTIGVQGYHSIEPEIVASLIEAEYIREGKAAALQVVKEFENILSDAAATSDLHTFRRGDFGDYGDREILYSLSSLEFLLTNKDTNHRQHQKALHSSLYAPQASRLFEIVSTSEGIKIQNRETDEELASSAINIHRKQYADLFKALMGQTSQGLGRTAPTQLVEFLFRAKSMLYGKPMIDNI